MTPLTDRVWIDGIRAELVGNILPFWMRYAPDQSDGFNSVIDEDLHIDNATPRASVAVSRILWTFSVAARRFGPDYRPMAERAYKYLMDRFWDNECGGLYWMVNSDGVPVSTRKQIYSQAFGIYGLAEYHQLTGDKASLRTAHQMHTLIEQHSADRRYHGYIEALGQDWTPLRDMRLSDKDINCPKTMNTHLHVMEAYTNLLRADPDDALKVELSNLVDLTLDRIMAPDRSHLRLFFDQEWNSQSDQMSFGHDIEASWLLVEAAEVLGSKPQLERARNAAISLAGSVLRNGIDPNGGINYEARGSSLLIDSTKHWWVQAEALVGFFNAYQLTGDDDFRLAALQIWRFIQERIVNRGHGEWHAKLAPDGHVLTMSEDPEAYLIGPWKCPYHNARACFEMLRRIH
jgi:mannobiose 2-epimerase